jgi:hypothetical protein
MRKRRKKRSQRTSSYRSGFEETLASQLKRGGVNFEYETVKLKYVKKATYTPDFILPNGIIIEAKGLFTAEDRTKHILIREQHPHLDIRMVFMNAYNKLRKGSNTTYARWCEKKNIIYAHKTIPKSWLLQQHTNHAISAEVPMPSPPTTTVAPIVSVATITLEEEIED